ncbi:MAG: NapC/NirT family cytochrome c [Candidatus Sumerlaeia bacterium]
MNEMNTTRPGNGAPAPSPANDRTPPPLTRNLTSYIGWVLTLVIGVIELILIVNDLFFYSQESYKTLVTYLIMPGFLLGGVALIWLGAALEWRRRHKKHPGDYPRLPVVDLNKKWQRERVTLVVILLSVFFTLSAIGVYRSYHFTESPFFCGQVCHQVMKPEYTAYQHSPHARVTCTECHIGSGANWYVKSKMSGLRQVWATATKTYHLPISTPVRNLRPARDTCEECHWPEKFSGNLEKEIWHFSPDKANTPTRYNLLLKIGGGRPEAGQGRGIHWHINPKVTVRYWARDEQRMDIPWVEVTVDGRPPRVFRSPDCPQSPPEGAEIRTMDCIDCHNRPSHIYRSPRQLIDSSLAAGTLDSTLPFFKRYATQLLEQRYDSTQAALDAIAAGLSQKYKTRMEGSQGAAQVQRGIQWLQELYQANFFPEQGVDWRVYPNHISHFEFPGCYRCHDERHADDKGAVISNDCELCHTFVDQAEGEAAFQPVAYRGGEFHHPRNLGDIWKGRNCTDCHGLVSGNSSPLNHDAKP